MLVESGQDRIQGVKLLLPLEGRDLPEPLRTIEPAQGIFETIVIAQPNDAKPTDGPWPIHRIGLSSGFPDFGEIHGFLQTQRPDACILTGDTIFVKLCALAAEMLDIPVFVFLNREADLWQIPRDEGNGRDLFFITDPELLGAVVGNPWYGSRLFYIPRTNQGRSTTFTSIVEKWAGSRLDPPAPDLSVIVPAYREAGNVGLVCDRLLKALAPCSFSWEILIVDDASPDDTYARALEQMGRSPRIRALTKPTPRGMGRAIERGLGSARARTIAITMGDGSDQVECIPEMYDAVRVKGFAVAIGTRYRRRENYENVPWLYRFWSRCFRIVCRFSTGLKLTDYTNAFRVFDKKIFDRYGPESGGFEISPEITFKSQFAAGGVTEVDVYHLKRSSGQSTFSFLKAGPGYAKILVKAVVARFTRRWFVLDW